MPAGLAGALRVLSSSSLRHAEVYALRAGRLAEQEQKEQQQKQEQKAAAAPAPAPAPSPAPASAKEAAADTPDSAPLPAPAEIEGEGEEDIDVSAHEPPMNTRAEVKAWRRWAADQAKHYRDTVHPRLVRKGKPPIPLPLSAKPNDVLNTVGIAPALYLDFLKFGAGYCLLGVLLSIPSYMTSYSHFAEVYPQNLTSIYPTSLLVLSVAARSKCATPQCKDMNVAAAIGEVVFSLLLLLGVVAFRRRARKLAAINDANNVYTREYAVQLHGMPKNATAQEVKDHIEAVLTAPRPHGGGLHEEAAKVWDVCLILNSTTVLRNAIKQAPLERKFSILKRKYDTMVAFQKERNAGWSMTQKLGELKNDAYTVGKRLHKAREKIGGKGFGGCKTVVGAFVTFEEQAAAHAMLRLYGGSVLHYWLQKPALRLHGKHKLKAYPATQPRDVLHENLPYRILALNARGLGTFVRRLVSFTVLACFMTLSFATILVVNSAKDQPLDWIALARIDRWIAMEEDGSMPGYMVTIVDTVLPLVASMVVVVVNVCLSALVGCLGEFERHPTLSGMHKAKATAVFISQAFNTGWLPLLVSMAPPTNAVNPPTPSTCACANPVFCCTFGRKGFFLRGSHGTLDADWQVTVGTILTSSLIIQTVVALVTWAVPGCVHRIKRCLKRASVFHMYDMEALYEGPQCNLPQLIGKAYAFTWVMLMYAGVLPILYGVGVVFFGGVWLAERYALFRIHRTPPPYSYELVHDTLWWMPWAVCTHLIFTFYSYASLPTYVVGGYDWTPPLGNGGSSNTSAVALLAGLSSGIIGGEAGSAVSGATSAIVEGLSYAYGLPSHVNSYATVMLAAAAAALLLILVLLFLRASPLGLLLWRPIEALLVSCWVSLSSGYLPCEAKGKASARVSVAPGDKSSPRGSQLEKGAARVTGSLSQLERSSSTANASLVGTTVVVDPRFSKVVEGIERRAVRTFRGKVVHVSQLRARSTTLGCLSRYTPTSVIFRLLGIYLERPKPITRQEWKRARPVFTQLTRAADISYQPEFHPDFEKAFVFLREPGKLQAFLAAQDPKKPIDVEVEEEEDKERADVEQAAALAAPGAAVVTFGTADAGTGKPPAPRTHTPPTGDNEQAGLEMEAEYDSDGVDL